MEKLIIKYLSEYKTGRQDFDYGDACILNGCMQMHQAVGDRKYLEFVTKYLENVIDDDGNIKNNRSELNRDSINTLRVLFYIHDLTGEEKYIRAIELVYGKLRELQRNTYEDSEIYPGVYRGIYPGIYPWYMEYETRYNKKANYNDIVTRLLEGKQEAGSAAVQSAQYLMTVIDVIDAMSIEIFEHYKTLEKLFKEEIKKLLPEWSRRESEPAKGGEEGDFFKSCMAYAVLKACRIGVLSKEKYEETGLGVFDAVMPERIFRFGEKGLSECETGREAENAGIFMMAYAQKLMMEK